MALTMSFKELVEKRVASDPAFKEALLREGIDIMRAGDIHRQVILRDYTQQFSFCLFRDFHAATV